MLVTATVVVMMMITCNDCLGEFSKWHDHLYSCSYSSACVLCFAVVVSKCLLIQVIDILYYQARCSLFVSIIVDLQSRPKLQLNCLKHSSPVETFADCLCV